MNIETKEQANEMAEILGIGNCPVCGIVTADPKNHCKQKAVEPEKIIKPSKTELLDKHWVKDKGVWCPFCGRRKLWRDEHEDKDATHYCTNCKESMALIGACAMRETEE